MTNLPFDFVSESYGYLWGWPSRAESAGSIAARLQQTVRLLAEAGPGYGDLWPFGVGRKGVPGPVLSITPEKLAELIDRRARFDPPRSPAPVGPWGYDLALANDRRSPDPVFVRLYVSAGRYWEYGPDNSVVLHVNPNGRCWQDDALVRHLFETLTIVWEAKWATVWRRWATEDSVFQTPRLAWSAEPLMPRPVPPYSGPYPFPFPFEQPPKSRIAHPVLGGELQEWS